MLTYLQENSLAGGRADEVRGKDWCEPKGDGSGRTIRAAFGF